MTQPPFPPQPPHTPRGGPALTPPLTGYAQTPGPAAPQSYGQPPAPYGAPVAPAPYGHPHDQAPPGYTEAPTGYPQAPAGYPQAPADPSTPAAPGYAAPAPTQPIPDLLHGEQAGAPTPPFIDGGRKKTKLTARDRRLVYAIGFLVGAFVTWKFALPHNPADTAVTPATPAGTINNTPPTAKDWQTAVPKTRAAATTDANTLTAHELAPKRFAHQLSIVNSKLQKGEELRLIGVQSDGTIVALAATPNGPTSTARWIASKKDLAPAPLPPAAGYTSLQPLGTADVNARTPAKLLRVIARAHGLAPGALLLQHPTAGAFGSAPTWWVKWPGAVGTVYASADGHTLRH